MKNICLLGATGSIGEQTLDVIKAHDDKFQLTAMSFGKNAEKAAEIIETFKPKYVSVGDEHTYEALKQHSFSYTFKTGIGEESLIEAAVSPEADVVVNALVGSVGLLPTLKAMEHKKTVALANKETLVTAGHIVKEHAQTYDVPLLPVDSEHSAIFQALQGENPKHIKRLIVTASGGSFRDRTRQELEGVTVEEALNHPNWSMGAKITIDSATMMNKGLEVIEAHWLFDLPYDRIDVLLHKESIIHSMVEFHDRSVIAQLGTPDMRVPIQYALSYPERLPFDEAKSLELWEVGQLNFAQADFERFRCLQFAYESGKIGGTMPTVLNAANEEAVAAFLSGRISFLRIEDIIEKALERHQVIAKPSLQEIREVDKDARKFVQTLLT
ncbi:1-deoxy-D-xylulose 5-phosphate reductoisomerase [Bacillus paralicheniformis]|uniref:1-deoxy-D-xylulose 5-phosphate reductoisomerase n=1 Tax=Bacillus paralicheniformis TaxID=1648923 RepID=A0ABY3FXH3_9BACI|nr:MULTISPECIES: 1-deoxy-D-xylulose-5-phosphate reductoisomerase [Bacillus]KUL19305.1 1-deoxy-D-xylulose 5-phosphate reductoisomerase [Bacillus licheniformis LMG 6934]KAA0840571.1 1-deoxy-D-xylulose-5-phosphate reductoisomerase [Bacillus paralicheniformis]KAA0841696.1 1-deoxy-D-xylulose-5-phosphate reductoisomerase [Bacillus paralicheniformis]MBG9884206.1 1-deoxy-D-xylulose 5-phosphate reductoisomerase [Bacillus paralicheniformis]MBU5326611.1 1-deoxy-D-xylulose-5-phosphate reductoisomerase [Ba